MVPLMLRRHGNTIKLLKACVAAHKVPFSSYSSPKAEKSKELSVFTSFFLQVPDIGPCHVITDDFCCQETPLPSFRYIQKPSVAIQEKQHLKFTRFLFKLNRQEER